MNDSWSKIICRVIGEQNAEPKPGKIEVRWDYTASGSASAQKIGAGISVSKLVEAKGKERAKDTDEDEEGDPFADDKGPLSPGFKDARNWKEIEGVVKLVSGTYEGI